MACSAAVLPAWTGVAAEAGSVAQGPTGVGSARLARPPRRIATDAGRRPASSKNRRCSARSLRHHQLRGWAVKVADTSVADRRLRGSSASTRSRMRAATAVFSAAARPPRRRATTSVTALVVDIEPDARLRHVVGHDQIHDLARELLARVSDDVMGFGGKADEQRTIRSTRATAVGQGRARMSLRPRQREHQRPSLLDNLLRRRAPPACSRQRRRP